MNRSTPGLPVHHQLLKFTQTHVHRVSDAIQPSHPLSSPSHPAPSPSKYQGLFQWVSSSHEVAKVLEFQLEHQSFQRNPRVDLLQNGLVGSPCCPRDSKIDSQQEFAVWLRKLTQGLCINLQGWDGEGSSKERGYMYTYGWFVLRLERKQHNSVKQLSFSKKKKKEHILDHKSKVHDLQSNLLF